MSDESGNVWAETRGLKHFQVGYWHFKLILMSLVAYSEGFILRVN